MRLRKSNPAPPCQARPGVAGSRNDSEFLDQEENADGIGQDEKRGHESVVQTGIDRSHQVVDEGEMQSARESANRPRERRSFLRGEEWVGNKEKAEDHIPTKRQRPMCRREVLQMPLHFQRPGEGERHDRDPAAARENSEPEQTAPKSNATEKTAVGSGMGNFHTTISRSTKGMAAASAGTFRRLSLGPNARLRTSKVAALVKKIPNPPTTVRIASMLSWIGGAVTTHSPAVMSVATSATISARTEAADQARATATRSIRSTQAQTANDVSRFRRR